MQHSPGEFAVLLEAAALDIERQERHPGQALPGVWNITPENRPEVVIGVIVSGALARVCAALKSNLDRALASYVDVSRNVGLVPKGAPDQIAVRHLRDCAGELRRIAGGSELCKIV